MQSENPKMKKHISDEKLGVAIIGCGLIGRKRAQALGSARLVVCVDTVRERAEALAQSFNGAEASSDWQSAVARKDVKVVIVSTTNDALSPVTIAALQAGKPVLVEKALEKRLV